MTRSTDINDKIPIRSIYALVLLCITANPIHVARASEAQDPDDIMRRISEYGAQRDVDHDRSAKLIGDMVLSLTDAQQIHPYNGIRQIPYTDVEQAVAEYDRSQQDSLSNTFPFDVESAQMTGAWVRPIETGLRSFQQWAKPDAESYRQATAARLLLPLIESALTKHLVTDAAFPPHDVRRLLMETYWAMGDSDAVARIAESMVLHDLATNHWVPKRDNEPMGRRRKASWREAVNDFVEMLRVMRAKVPRARVARRDVAAVKRLVLQTGFRDSAASALKSELAHWKFSMQENAMRAYRRAQTVLCPRHPATQLSAWNN